MAKTDDLDEMEKWAEASAKMAEKVMRAIDNFGGEENAEDLIRAELNLPQRPHQIPLMSKEEAEEVIEEEQVMRAVFFLEDLGDILEGPK